MVLLKFHFGILHFGIYHKKAMNNNIYSKNHLFLIKQLKKAREESGLSQGDVAEIFGKTQSYISKAESGQRKIDVIQLNEFAKIYKKDINFFIK